MEQDLRKILAVAIAEMPQQTEAERIVARICEEVHSPPHLKRRTHAPASSSKTLRALKDRSRELQIDVLKAALTDHMSALGETANLVWTCRSAIPGALISHYDLRLDDPARGILPNWHRRRIEQGRMSDGLDHRPPPLSTEGKIEPALQEMLTIALAELPKSTNAELLVARICEEAALAFGPNMGPYANPNWSNTFNELREDPEMQFAVLMAALADIRSSIIEVTYSLGAFKNRDLPPAIIRECDLLNDHLILQIFLSRFLEESSFFDFTWIKYGGVTLVSLVEALEDLAQKETLPSAIRKPLGEIHKRLRAENAPSAKFAARIEQLLDPGLPARPLPPGQFADAYIARNDALPDARRAVWTELGKVAARSGRKAQPSRKWLADAARALEPLEAKEFVAELSTWLEWKQTDRAYDLSLDVLRGLIRTIPMTGDGELAGPLSRFCERYFRRASPRSAELGTVALQALFELRGDQRAIAELLRLGNAVRHKPGLKTIKQMIAKVAQERGLSIDELEEEMLPTYGLGADSKLYAWFGDARATLTLSATGISTVWVNRSGKQVKSIPAEIRRESKKELAAFKRQITTIENARKAQARRLERSWLEERSWTLADWQANYLEHTLRRPIVSALIWRIEQDSRLLTVVPTNGKLVDITGAQTEVSDTAKVRLWHPLDSRPEEVFAWRDRIIALGLTQPIKQAHREVYVTTDAERKTGTYSNRFAAHILRKYQLNALRKSCGWNSDSYGSFEDPERRLPKLGIRIEFQMEWVGDGHVATDQVRFHRLGSSKDPIRLDQIAPVIFSEIMRDCDLFVAVASVANDPTWSDGGPEGRHRNYWHEWSFGELGQSAQVRRELIGRYAANLSIADKLEIGEKALIVTGKRQKYAIHFGSTNIQILPDNRYLCIVPDRSAPEADRVRLPFTGDNQVSTILAKAFMLVDEDRITDTTILNQL